MKPDSSDQAPPEANEPGDPNPQIPQDPYASQEEDENTIVQPRWTLDQVHRLRRLVEPWNGPKPARSFEEVARELQATLDGFNVDALSCERQYFFHLNVLYWHAKSPEIGLDDLDGQLFMFRDCQGCSWRMVAEGLQHTFPTITTIGAPNDCHRRYQDLKVKRMNMSLWFDQSRESLLRGTRIGQTWFDIASSLRSIFPNFPAGPYECYLEYNRIQREKEEEGRTPTGNLQGSGTVDQSSVQHQPATQTPSQHLAVLQGQAFPNSKLAPYQEHPEPFDNSRPQPLEPSDGQTDPYYQVFRESAN